MRVQESVLLAPIRIGRLTPLIQLLLCVLEDKPNVQVWILLLNQQVFLSVLSLEQALHFDNNPVGKDKIRRILMVCRRFRILDFVLLIGFLLAKALELLADGVFKAAPLYWWFVGVAPPIKIRLSHSQLKVVVRIVFAVYERNIVFIYYFIVGKVVNVKDLAFVFYKAHAGCVTSAERHINQNLYAQ